MSTSLTGLTTTKLLALLTAELPKISFERPLSNMHVLTAKGRRDRGVRLRLLDFAWFADKLDSQLVPVSTLDEVADLVAWARDEAELPGWMR